ncbi:MAG TPA: hypothetical protein VFZ24_00210 [Longimicrobiales bacterium]
MSDATSTAALRPSRSTTSATMHASRPPPAAAHALFALWIAGLLLAGTLAPARYETWLQEDRFIEWWTVILFGAAALFAFRRAWHGRRVFDALVGAFCFFVAGEEFSWGQRLLGITPPAPFLEHNFQQELTLHNFADIFGQPKWILVLALIGFGLLLPAAARIRAARPLLDRSGATVPAIATVPWFATAIALLVWYPLSYTGEWVEALAGGLFLTTFAPAPRAGGIAAALGALLALALTAWSARGSASAGELACARAETAALVEDLAYGTGATGRLAGASAVHKRVFTAGREEYIDMAALAHFTAADCPADAAARERRQHAVDPWGTAYWVAVARGADSIALRVYSFGPNRRRDGGSLAGGGDDVGTLIVLRP